MGKLKRGVNIQLEGFGSIQASSEECVLNALLREKIKISSACGGMGSCGTCRVQVLSETKLPARNELEAERAQELGFPDNLRLSCQLCCMDGLVFKIPQRT